MRSSPGSGLRIAVTGAAGAIGSRLVARLAAWDAVEAVVALDVRPVVPPSPRVIAYRQDIAEPVGPLLRDHGVGTVVHLAFQMRPGRDRETARRVNVGGTERVLQGCGEAGVRHLLCFSSATVYGAHPDNPVPLTEDAPLRPVRGFQYAEDKAAAEALLARFRAERPESHVAVLRGCVVMGPGMESFITQALSRPVLVGVRGSNPPMQFLHEDDLMEAMLRLLAGPGSGTYNIAGGGTVRYGDMAQIAGRRLLRLPAPLLYPLTQAAWTLRLQGDSPAPGLDMVRWPWVVSTERLQRETGWSPGHTSREALEAAMGPSST